MYQKAFLDGFDLKKITYDVIEHGNGHVWVCVNEVWSHPSLSLSLSFVSKLVVGGMVVLCEQTIDVRRTVSTTGILIYKQQPTNISYQLFVLEELKRKEAAAAAVCIFDEREREEEEEGEAAYKLVTNSDTSSGGT